MLGSVLLIHCKEVCYMAITMLVNLLMAISLDIWPDRNSFAVPRWRRYLKVGSHTGQSDRSLSQFTSMDQSPTIVYHLTTTTGLPEVQP